MRTSIRFVFGLILLLACTPWAASRSDAGKLADDGRAGDVAAIQGTALVRPPDRLRWTPLARRDLVLPGDIIRTAPRGAHALELRMGGAELLLGPGTSVELKSRTALHLRQGVIEVKASEKHPITVTGAGDFRQDVTGTLWAQSDARKATALAEAPKWLQQYRASTSNEWMGALVANVDGREVNLAVGSYSVVAEVRDQIARTTIEQAFVNTTSSTLEGVFYFPLPAGASISGFGMWIGDELVEADVVERQRARQIYEDILRRKKDPGLLEWEGGNLFKARVFPIFGNSTKRIRIRYTQVLPLEGRTIRYGHALRSELLRSKPLRDLNIVVRVDASAGIDAVGSATHDVQVQKTDTTAEVRFAAQEFTPENDFELTVRLKQPAPLALLPHRRGDDGYFLLQLSPPGSESGGWKRELVPEGKPLDILVVADTSGSMNEGARRNQDRFLSALMQVLGEKDRVRLMAYDVEPVWIQDSAVAANSDAWANALNELRLRRSLGWSDLDKAFAAAAKAAPKADEGFVLYLGDGVGTTGDADPQALADRLRNAHPGLTVHAVAPSSSYETPVLESLASLGGGTLREIGSNPAKTAATLLGEALRPMVRDLSVEIDGIRTARVYPAKLPNLPVGMQQSVLGRFLPTDVAQDATVVVKGTLAGRPVTYRTKVTVPPTDGGNSFLSRLWGRKHIDTLLAQGRSKSTQDEIVEFSERFGIMTPYTSFLVLESDEDRERYGVQRRVRMRDGERFFAQARDKVALEARRDAVKRASGWRTRQRHEVLREIARLGRDLPIPYPYVTQAVRSGAIGIGGGAGAAFGARDDVESASEALRSELATKGKLGRARGNYRGPAGEVELEEAESLGFWNGASADGGEPADAAGAAPAATATAPPRSPASDPSAGASPANEDGDGFSEGIEDFEQQDDDKASEPAARKRRSAGRPMAGGGRYVDFSDYRSSGEYSVDGRRKRVPWPQPPQPWSLTALGFPALPPAFELPQRATKEDPWPEEERALLRSLERRADVADAGRGLYARIVSKRRHPQRALVQSATLLEAWLGAAQWRMRHAQTSGGEPAQAWVTDGKRGTLHRARRLARRRPVEKQDGLAWRLPLWDLGTTSALHSWEDQGYVPKITERSVGRVHVELRHPAPESNRFVLVIDTAKRVVLETRVVQHSGEVIQTVRRSAHVLVGARHYPTKVEHINTKGEITFSREATWQALDEAALTKALAPVATLPDDVLLVEGKLPKEVDAKQARHEGRAGYVEHLALALASAGRSQWDDALASWALARKVGPQDRIGSEWVHLALLQHTRRGPAVKSHAESLVPVVNRNTGLSAVFLARFLTATANNVLGWNVRLALHESVERPWSNADESFDPELAKARRSDWVRRRAVYFGRVNRPDEARAARLWLAENNPFHLGDQRAYVSDLRSAGEHAAAIGHIERLIADREPWSDAERNTLYGDLLRTLWDRRQLTKLNQAANAWAKRMPEHQNAHWHAISTLFFLAREAEADTWIQQQLATRPTVDADKVAQAKLNAAVSLGLGQGWNFSIRTLTPLEADRLHDLALHGFRQTGRKSGWTRSIGQRIKNDWRFGRTDAARRLTLALREDFLTPGAIEAMDVDRMSVYIQELSWDADNATTEDWRSAVDRVRARWTGAEEPETADRIAGYVLHLLDAHGEQKEAIAFVRERLNRANKAQRGAVLEDLVGRLLALEAGGEPVENEIATLIAGILERENSDQNRRGRAAEFARLLADRFSTWRYEAALGPKKDRDGWTRAERKQRNKDARTRTRQEIVARLETLREGAPDVWKPWLALERVGYGLQVGEDVPAFAAAAFGILDDASEREDPLARLRRERAATAVAYACARKNASQELRDRTLARFHAGLEAEPKGDDAKPLLDWRHHIWRLLMALDRPDALADTLRTWVVPAKVESRWRIHLGYLEAELGRLPEAIVQFDAAHAVGELNAPELQFVANLHLVRGDDEARRAALDAAMAREADWRLSNRLWQAINRLSRRGSGVAEELDPETIRVTRVLVRKASWPANYINQVARLYRTTKDHRVLEALADGIPGHTKEALYQFLGRVENITKQIHEEATCDALTARLREHIASTDNATDRRGMRLTLARVESRAAQVPEADPAHASRALAALRAARQDDFVPGEPRLLANFFAQLGRIDDRAFSREVLSQAEALFDREAKGSADRIAIGMSVARIEWTYASHEAALARLHGLVREARATDGRISRKDKGLLDVYVSWLLSKKRYRIAEQELLTELGAWKQAQRRREIREALYRLYVGAVIHGSATSRGQGRALFEAVAGDLEREMNDQPAQARSMLDIYCGMMSSAHKERAVAGVAQFFETFVSKRLPGLFERLPMSTSRMANRVASTLKDLSGHRRALAFFLDTYDGQPNFVKRMEQDVWSRSAGSFAQYRYHAGTLGGLEPRLLQLVITQLEKNLRAGGSWRGNGFWNKGNRWFWSQKEQDFADAANRVAELEGERPQIVVTAARLLYDSLRRRGEGIDVLRSAYDRGGLLHGGQYLLVQWYEQQKRYAVGIPVIAKLVAEAQDNVAYRLMLARLQLGVDKQADALGTLQQIETRWRESERWNYDVASKLGQLAATRGLPEPGVTWLEEALRLRQEARGNRGGQDTLTARWYGWLAEARSRLGNWKGALSAATAGLQATNRNNQRQRNRAIEAIHRVVQNAPDLDAFAKAYDADAEKTGVDATVIRRQFARVLLSRSRPTDAIRHLLAARELDGGDADVHRMLVDAYDKANRPKEAIEALFGSIRLAPHNVAAYTDLAQRFVAAGNEVQAERARTNLVEPSPNQPDGHRQLAALRTKAGLHPAARTQWEQVVRTAPLDPTGWLALGDACRQVGDTAAARKAYEHVISTEWESRFGDVKKTAAASLAEIG